MQNTSWENVSSWYDSLIGERGGYYQSHVVYPGVLQLMDLKPGMHVLDLACGQGAFCRLLKTKGAVVKGADASPALIAAARKYDPSIEYVVDDARSLNKLEGERYDRIVCILALQNFDPIGATLKRVSELLHEGGTFTAVILHPAFRSPRITGWGEDDKRKLQFRRVDRYLSPMKIPIQMHPGKQQGPVTWTYHRPLSTYIELGVQVGLTVDGLEEWVSDKQSQGKKANEENLARREIPMFLALRFRK